jgi:hypothetical protein
MSVIDHDGELRYSESELREMWPDSIVCTFLHLRGEDPRLIELVLPLHVAAFPTAQKETE